MMILTTDNVPLDLNTIGENVDDIRYSVYDAYNKHPDFYFQPLIFVEQFSAQAIQVKIGECKLVLPIEEQDNRWGIIMGDIHSGDLETIPIKMLHNRDFNAFVFNPVSGFVPEFWPVTIDDIYGEIRWTIPRLRTGHFLCIPLENKPKPKCIYVAKDVEKQLEVLDITKIF